MSSRIYARLAVTNIRNNKKTYVPFLLTSVLTVMMYYIMDSLARSRDIGNQNVTTILMLALGILILFSVIFLFYTNSFLIKRRKKELAVYNILGMGKGHIAKMLTVETLLIGTSSMALGILGGLVFGRLMHLVLLAPPAARHRDHLPRVGDLHGVHSASVCRDLLPHLALQSLPGAAGQPGGASAGSAAGEREPKTKRILALAGLAALGTGYYLAVVTDNPLEALNTFFVAALLVVIGTYAIFLAGSIAILKALRRRKSFYYKPNHFTVVSGMIYRMKQNAVGLANICILSTMVLVMISTTVSLYAGMDSIMDRRFPMTSACGCTGQTPGRRWTPLWRKSCPPAGWRKRTASPTGMAAGRSSGRMRGPSQARRPWTTRQTACGRCILSRWRTTGPWRMTPRRWRLAR